MKKSKDGNRWCLGLLSISLSTSVRFGDLPQIVVHVEQPKNYSREINAIRSVF